MLKTEQFIKDKMSSILKIYNNRDKYKRDKKGDLINKKDRHLIWKDRIIEELYEILRYGYDLKEEELRKKENDFNLFKDKMLKGQLQNYIDSRRFNTEDKEYEKVCN